jgi:hypothetical protein
MSHSSALFGFDIPGLCGKKYHQISFSKRNPRVERFFFGEQ